MNSNTHGKPSDQKQEQDGMLERIARKIDPSGTEVTDEEIMDPGSNIRENPPQQKPTSHNPPPRK